MPSRQQKQEEVGGQQEEEKENRGWERYFAKQFKSASTLRMYTGRVRAYCRWLAA
jgi:integrase